MFYAGYMCIALTLDDTFGYRSWMVSVNRAGNFTRSGGCVVSSWQINHPQARIARKMSEEVQNVRTVQNSAFTPPPLFP